MTAKEKALELGNKFYQGNPLVYSKQEHLDELQNAKTRALICVEEIISIKREYLNTNSESIFYSYWKEVKTEIENL